MRKTLAILIAILIGYSTNCSAQGKVARLSQQQSQTGKPKKFMPKVTESTPDGYINEHGYVDLGLPSGLKWATCNIGASYPQESGNYYAWGETDTKPSYADCLTYGKQVSELESEGIVNGNGALTVDYDAASAQWHGSWRMPTEEELDELVKECQWQWTTLKDKNGYMVTGLNGNSIFLPAAGDRNGSSLYSDGEYGYYWGTTVGDGTTSAHCVEFNARFHSTGSKFRSYGFNVRAVSK